MHMKDCQQDQVQAIEAEQVVQCSFSISLLLSLVFRMAYFFLLQKLPYLKFLKPWQSNCLSIAVSCIKWSSSMSWSRKHEIKENNVLQFHRKKIG